MQLFALDLSGHITSASVAEKSCDYFCIECGAFVRKRSGLHRRAHFFHLDSSPSCRLSAKTMEHLQTQLYIYNNLPADEGKLEWINSTICRIADVAWISQKIIFEIQCSPITALELTQRTAAWRSEGFHVIWILHDNRYNKKRLCAAEAVLSSIPHYFTNINQDGLGIIYDQYELVDSAFRTKYQPKLAVEIARPIFLYASLNKNFIQKNFPFSLALRCQRHISFSGDLLDSWMHQLLNENISELLTIELISCKSKYTKFSFTKIFIFFKFFFNQYLLKPYLAILRALLEQAAK